MSDEQLANAWQRVATATDVDAYDTLAIELEDGAPVCLYRLQDGYFATDNMCTHGEALLSDGLIVDDRLIECPLHEGTFDIRTGAAVGAPCTKGLSRYELRFENGELYLRR